MPPGTSGWHARRRSEPLQGREVRHDLGASRALQRQIFQILEDDDGNLWMNCNTGIWRTSVEQLNEVADGRRTAVESFGYHRRRDVEQRRRGGQLAGWKMRDGSLWFPTTKGIVVIDPRRRDTEPPRVMIEGITIDREPSRVGGPDPNRPRPARISRFTIPA